mmetsp:Transcript_17584/g.48254  ORF Transcript_17584/g.48254 Transcript_17584/m.48254 type:complete len:155 (+) Transcript_17584:139-603(+)
MALLGVSTSASSAPGTKLLVSCRWYGHIFIFLASAMLFAKFALESERPHQSSKKPIIRRHHAASVAHTSEASSYGADPAAVQPSELPRKPLIRRQTPRQTGGFDQFHWKSSTALTAVFACVTLFSLAVQLTKTFSVLGTFGACPKPDQENAKAV